MLSAVVDDVALVPFLTVSFTRPAKMQKRSGRHGLRTVRHSRDLDRHTAARQRPVSYPPCSAQLPVAVMIRRNVVADRHRMLLPAAVLPYQQLQLPQPQ